MFTRLFKRSKSMGSTSSLFGTVQSTTSSSNSGTLYTVTIPGQAPVNLRATNQVEVKRMVREAHGLTRLPAGTTVERAD